MPQARFERIGNDIRRWISQGNALWSAAEYLREAREFGPAGRSRRELDLVRAMLLLRAFALECLFKAMWLRAGGKLAAQGRFEKVPGIDNHNLVELAAKVKFTVNAAERELLSRVTHFGCSDDLPPIAPPPITKVPRLG